MKTLKQQHEENANQMQIQLEKQRTEFALLKNGKNARTVWANPVTKEIYSANRNSFGYNAEYHLSDWFYNKYGSNMKTNQGKADYRKFYYSAKAMNEVGFRLVMRGEAPLW